MTLLLPHIPSEYDQTGDFTFLVSSFDQNTTNMIHIHKPEVIADFVNIHKQEFCAHTNDSVITD
jgi:hypothetical protein